FAQGMEPDRAGPFGPKVRTLSRRDGRIRGYAPIGPARSGSVLFVKNGLLRSNRGMRRTGILLPNPLKPTPHSGLGAGEYYAMHFMGALFPASAGVFLFGWRAAATVALVILA